MTQPEKPEPDAYFSGKLLAAMPGMPDPRFARAVVYICAHDASGAMGLILNKPRSEVDFREIITQLGLEAGPSTPECAVHFGGPVDVGRGFVLHSSDYEIASATLPITEGFSLTSTMEVLEDLSHGGGPDAYRLMLGYAGWGPEQLEGEIQNNDWLVSPADPELVFETPPEKQWEGTLAKLGIDAVLLTSGGSA